MRIAAVAATIRVLVAGSFGEASSRIPTAASTVGGVETLHATETAAALEAPSQGEARGARTGLVVISRVWMRCEWIAVHCLRGCTALFGTRNGRSGEERG